MQPGFAKPDQNPVAATIDAVATGVDDLRRRLTGRDPIASRDLRALWNQRLRPFWRLHPDIYRALSRRFLEAGENYLSSEVAEEGGEFFGDDVPLLLTRALAVARSGAPQAAQALLARKEAVLADAEEAKSLMARTFKDLWKSSGDRRPLQRAFDLYFLDYTTTKGDRTFPGVNAASMALFLDEMADARRIAGEVLEILGGKADTSSYWDQVTRAECLLVSGRIAEAREAYAEASAGGKVPHAHLATTRAQARLILGRLGEEESAFDACFPLPGVLAFTGHRIDAPGRARPRLPDADTAALKEEIRAAVARSGAGFGYAAAANGADLLFLECLQEAGLETYIHLPLPVEDFVRASVEDAQVPGWVDRFRAALARATDVTWITQKPGPLAFDYGNRLFLGAAALRARQLGTELRLLTVWDGRPGQRGDGGTGDCVALAREAGFAIEVITPPGGPAPDSGPAATPPAPAEKLLTVLTLHLQPGDEAEHALVAAVAGRTITHREFADGRVRMFFSDPTEAARAARAIVERLPDRLAGAIGLHAGPVTERIHPLTGGVTITGEALARAGELAALEPAGLIYTSFAGAAMLGLEGGAGAGVEFLGYRQMRPAAAREPVFQLVRDGGSD
jgi:hypothetical protein